MSVGVSGLAIDLVGDLDQELRAVVRRERVDPQLESARVRRLAEEVVRAHDERSLTGVVAPVPDPVGVVGELVARVSGFGPLQPFLDDPEVEEIWINDPSRVFVARNGRHELTNVILSRAEVQELVERMLKSSGRRIDLSQPFVDAMLPQGHRLHVVLEGISREFAAVNIRKFVLKAARLNDLVRLGSMPPQAARFLEAAVLAGQNIVVAGGTQAGKTTMLNCLAAAIPGGDRIISAEEVFELRFSHPDWVPMQTRQAGLEGTGEVSLRDLVRETLRMRPTRIIVGEVRAAECLDLLLALNAGLPGMATIHANSAREALVKLCTLPLLAGENISARFVVPTVASSVDLVVHLGLDNGGVRRVNEIVAVPGGPRTTSSRSSLSSSGRAATSCTQAGCRPVSTPTNGQDRHTPAAPGRRLMGAVLGLLLGVGLLLIWSSFRHPTATDGAQVAAAATVEQCRTRRGEHHRIPVRVPPSCAVVATGAVLLASRTLPVALIFGAMGGYLPLAVLKGRARRRQREFAEVWPEAVDNLASAVRAGMSLPEALRALGTRARTAAGRLRRVRPGLPGQWPLRRLLSTGSRTASPTPSATGWSRACASRARSVAATSAGCSAASPASCVTTRAPAPSSQARQSWTVNGARLAVAAPWLVLLRCASSPKSSRGTQPAPASWCWSGAHVLCVIAYRAMVRIGRLPAERRILA